MPVFEFGEYLLETEEKRISRGAEVLTIPPKAFDLLAVLVSNAGHLFTKQELLNAVWPDSFVVESSLAQNIYLLRKALGENSASPRFIETVPRRGYRFIAPVSRLQFSEAQPISAVTDLARLHDQPRATETHVITQRQRPRLGRPLVIAGGVLISAVLLGSVFMFRPNLSGFLTNQRGTRSSRLLAGLPTANPEAYEHYTRGMFFWNERNEESTRRAIDSFQRAITADPNFALAYSMLGDSYGLVAYYRYNSILPQREAYQNAEAAITTAMSLNSEISETHVALAFIKLYYRQDASGAERELQRAIALDPNNGFAHQRYSSLLLVQGKLDQALSEIQIAHQLDPLSTRVTVSLATLLYYGRKYEDARAVCQKALDSDPNNPVLNHMLGVINISEGHPGDALEFFQRARSIGGPESDYQEGSGYVYALTGKVEETRKLISEMEIASARKGHYYRNPSTLVILYAAIGDVDKALKFIEEKEDWDVMRMRPLLEFDPLLDRLRADARFKELVSRRFNLDAPARRMISSRYTAISTIH
jgi:DNA-binding winged helix-turn-helix (wHTH) protein/Flp pilus assembly protein TadD